MKSKEVERLMRAIADKGHEIGCLSKTKSELELLGIVGLAERMFGPVSNVPQERAEAEHMAYVCTVIAPGEMLSLPDNKTAPCAWGCGRTIQFRPWAPAKLDKVCLYCAAERGKEGN